MNKADTLSQPLLLLLAFGFLFLAGIVVLFVQAFCAVKNRGTPGRVLPWNGTAEGFCLLTAAVVLTFLCAQMVLGGIAGTTGNGNEIVWLGIGLTAQAASLAVIFTLLPKANPEFRFQTGKHDDRLAAPADLADPANCDGCAPPEERDATALKTALKKIFGMWGVLPSFAGAMVVVGGASLGVRGVAKVLKRITGDSFGLDEQQQIVEVLMRHRGDWVFLGVTALTAVALAPLLEELFFRGLVHPFLKRRLGMVFSICATGALFGAIHFSAAAFLPLSLFGAYLCVLYEKTGDIRVPIAVHALFNLNTLFVVFVQGLTAGAV
jgi:membrane protease YdiL (CAAX protease family)